MFLISKLEVDSVTMATATATTSIHTKDMTMSSVNGVDTHDTESSPTHEQDKEPPHDSAEPHGPVTGPGDGL